MVAKTCSLIRKKEESVVLPNRPADCPTKLILVVDLGLVREKVLVIQKGIPVETLNPLP